ncbi:MAG TPA: protein kinase [Kofleriaceae bacterium]
MTKPTESDAPGSHEPTEALDRPRESTAVVATRDSKAVFALREPTAALESAALGSRDEVTRTVPPPGEAPKPWLATVQSAADLPVVSRAHYRVLREHARGGLGRIIQARDLRTGRVVAIKEMIVSSDIAARRFAREALITANLQHPSIVPVYELGRWETGEPFYAMKLVAGRSFKDELKQVAGLDDRLARLPIIVAVAEALAFAHARHVIHRDLKPANVLIGDFGETVVIDWGLAKTIGEADPIADDEPVRVRAAIDDDPTVAGAVLGTPSYMPPEQARGHEVDARADVYAIGAMLYHLIAGHAAYADKKPTTSAQVIALVTAGAPTPLREREHGTPLDLAAIVEKAMAREPADRYASASELAADLRRFTTGQLVGAHHYGRRTLFARWLTRHRAPVTVGAVLAGLLAIVATLGIRGVLAERDRVRTQRDIAVQETSRADTELASALYEKGLVAENAREWPRAAMYYAASRQHHDTPEAAWAAGLAEARAVVPSVRYMGHTAWVHAAAISPDGERVATVDDSGQLRVWSPRDGTTFAQARPAETALYAVAYSPDGNELAVAGDDGTIQRFDARSLEPIATLRHHTGRVWSVAYSPDGKLLASGGEDTHVVLWSLAGNVPLRELRGHTQRVYSVAFSPDGKLLASGGDDRDLWLWDVATGRGARRGSHDAGGIRAVAFAGDSIATSGWDHQIRLWKLGSTAPAEVWDDAHIVHAAAVAPGGKVLVTGGEMGAIHAWDLTTQQLITSLDAPGQTSTITFSRDGHWLVTAGKMPPIAWDATALPRLAGVGHHMPIGGLAFTADGKRLVSGAEDHTLRLWDIARATELRRISTGTVRCGDGVIAIGDDIAAACDDNTLKRWHPDGTVDVLPTDVWLRFTALSPSGVLAAGHLEGKLALVDVATWKVTIERVLHRHQVYGVEYGGNGELVTAGLDDRVRTWRGPDLTPDLDIQVGADDGELTAALSPDGTQLATATQTGIVAVWDVKRAAWLTRVTVPSAGTMWKLVFAPDGATAYTASDDGVVRAWSTRTWADPIALDAGEGPAVVLAVSPDAKLVAAGYQSGAIVIWDAASHRVAKRIGGRTRDRGSCADLATQAWVDDAHRAIVASACAASPAEYFARLSRVSHQRIVDEVDATWNWP